MNIFSLFKPASATMTLSKWIIPKYVKGHGVAKKWMILSAIMLVLQTGLAAYGPAAWYDYALVALWVVLLVTYYRQYVERVKALDMEDSEFGVYTCLSPEGWTNVVFLTELKLRAKWDLKTGKMYVPGYGTYSTYNNWKDAARDVSQKILQENQLREQHKQEVEQRKELRMFLTAYGHNGERLYREDKVCNTTETVDVVFPKFVNWFSQTPDDNIVWDTGSSLVTRSAIARVQYETREVYHERQ